MSGYVDAHCHLGQYPDPMRTLDDAVAAKVITVAVTESPEEFRRLRARLGRRRGVRLALGAHPLEAAHNMGQLSRFQRLLLQTDWVGEIGLDYSPAGRDTAAPQRQLLESILAMPQMHHKVISVHSRRAERDILKMFTAVELVAILHWWTGPPALIDEALAAGMWFSVNSLMLSSKSGRTAIGLIPSDRILTETDGPFARIVGRPLAPRSIPDLVRLLAMTWNVDTACARERVWDNMVELHRRRVPRSGDDGTRTGDT